MNYTRTAIESGRLGVIFPAGRLAKRRGLRLFERPWMTSAAMIARKYDLPVIPVNIRARNSVLFYLFDLMHPTLRDITLFHETLNKARQPFRVSIGAPIQPDTLAGPLRGRDRGDAPRDAGARRAARADRQPRRQQPPPVIRAPGGPSADLRKGSAAAKADRRRVSPGSRAARGSRPPCPNAWPSCGTAPSRPRPRACPPKSPRRG